jgi:MoaA/NifB/PqqE/SkfB family radical SAM enzyme
VNAPISLPPIDGQPVLPAIVPHQMTILTTSRCDAKCAHCLVSSSPSGTTRSPPGR